MLVFSLSIFFLDIKKKNISVGFLTSKTTVITTEYSDIDCSDYEELYRSVNLFQTWLVGFRDWLVNEVRTTKERERERERERPKQNVPS